VLQPDTDTASDTAAETKLTKENLLGRKEREKKAQWHTDSSN